MKVDFVCELVALARETVQVDEAGARALEIAVRSRFAGEVVRISRQAPITLEIINERLRARVPVSEIAADLGVSRATIYRRLSPKGRKKSRRDTD